MATAEYDGWYCEGCESFVTQKEHDENHGICPDHQKPYEHLTGNASIHTYITCSSSPGTGIPQLRWLRGREMETSGASARSFRAFRYFFLAHVDTFLDSDFTWEKFDAAYNNELANDLGNLG